MARGRKSSSTIYSSDWEQIYHSSQGYYFQYLISKLANQNILLSEENANNTLVLIKKEKEKLINEKKIKQGKLQEAELQSELIFNIPKNWAWCKLDDLCSNITDGTHQTPSYKESGRPFISAQHVKPFSFSPNKFKYVSEEAFQECIKSGKPERGDLLVTRVGAIGEAAVIDVDIEFAYYVSVGLIKPFNEFILSKFLVFIFNSPYGNLYSKGNVSSKGSSAGNFNLGRIRSFLIPLPPISEQEMILDFLEDLGKNSIKDSKIYLDKEIEDEIISIHKAQLLNNQTSNELTHQLDLIKQLRQAFLREAMQGKFVKSTNTRETGQQLLEKIKVEKAKLIAEKKLKKEKELPPIDEEEIPFEIPKHWAWCRLEEIGKITGGGTPSMGNPEYWNGNIPWISPKDMKLDRISDSEMKVTTKGIKESSTNLVPVGSLLIVGRSGILKRKLPVAINDKLCTVNQDMKVIVPHIIKMNRFLQLMFWSIENIVLNEYVKFGMTVHSLKYDEFSKMPIPIPPLQEQEQIVTKLEELMAFCDNLEQSIKESQGYNEMLLQQVLREALQGETV